MGPVRILAGATATTLVAIGAACAVLLGGTLGQALAYVFIALGLVLVTAWIFYEVGLSEDRERAAASRRRPAPRRTVSPGGRRPRLPRSDGHRRRL